MGGFYGAVSHRDCVGDVYYGADYHTHLGTKRGGMAVFSRESGIHRSIHNIENSQFRTKLADFVDEVEGTSAIGCISDTDPQPILIKSALGTYAITTVCRINNAQEIVDECIHESRAHFEVGSGGNVYPTELVAALINQKDSFEEGIAYAQERVEGTLSLLILKDDGSIIAARDKHGRLPIIIGRGDQGYSVTFESFANDKLGYRTVKELEPGEIVEISADDYRTLRHSSRGCDCRICAFLWTYYGYPTSVYEGLNVETARNRNGEGLADLDRRKGNLPEVDCVAGVPDSGTPHAIGYASKAGLPFRRPFIKYTPTWSRSFMPQNQDQRRKVARMKLMPVEELIRDRKLLFVDDSIVRGTQIKGTVDFLYECGAREVHIRSACPPIAYSCKYLNFSRSTSEMDLFIRRAVTELEGQEGIRHLNEYCDGTTERGRKFREVVCEKYGFTSFGYQSLEEIIKSIGLPEEMLCTYCWNGRE